MQRPRRTSEFNEEAGTAVKRQSRTLRRVTSTENTPTHGTAQKYTRRGTSVTGSATRLKAGPTPQKPVLQSARVLFTAEKPRGTTVLGLHNDKKWIQDNTQRITEFLKRSWYPGCGMAGINEDFFSRPNCLKQMSIKQFVSFINYFLHFVWGPRFTVGSNYVDDVFNILQKLNYPYQINKSWLKTPNTTHSFGNVIVLFDFLIDFVPTQSFEFPLQELPELTTTIQSEQLDPDLEFKTELLQECSKSFIIWDKQLDEEYKLIQRRLADLLVQKRCGIAGLDALEIELDRLYKLHEVLNKQLQEHISPEEEREYDRLKEFTQNLHKEFEQLSECYKKDKLRMEQICARKEKCNTKIVLLEKDIAAYEASINSQLCNVKQRDTCLEKMRMLRVELQGYERTVDDLEQRDYRQQVQLSVIKKNTTEEIVNLNTILRDITFTLAISEPVFQLQIKVNANAQSVERLLPHLKVLQNKMKKEIKKEQEVLSQYESEIEGVSHEIAVSIKPQMKAHESLLTAFMKRHEKLEQCVLKESEELYMREKNLHIVIKELQIEKENHQKQIQDRKNIVEQLVNECEEIMSKAETEHSAAYDARTELLDNCEANLNENINRIKELEELVLCDQSDKTLSEMDNDKNSEGLD